MVLPGSILNVEHFSGGQTEPWLWPLVFPSPSSTAVILLGNTVAGGCSALRIKKDELVCLILTPAGREPRTHCVEKEDSEKMLDLAPGSSVSPIDGCVKHLSLLLWRDVSEQVLRRRKETHIIVVLGNPRLQARHDGTDTENMTSLGYPTHLVIAAVSAQLTQMLLHLLSRRCS